MDLRGFNKPTKPNLYSVQTNLPLGTEYNEARSRQVPKSMEPASDARYPAYAAPMADGRLVTDYRPHCYKNLPPDTQFTTKLWMVHHADSIINLSRQRQSEWSGSSLPMARTVPPAADYVFSSPFENEIVPTNKYAGIGVERMDAKAPPLFGTFVIPPTRSEILNNTKKIALTTYQEGGRNSMRGSLYKFN